MRTTLKDQAAIVGIGATEFSKNSGRSELQLAAEAVRNALDDCGLKPRDVDGMTTFTLDTSDDIEVARAVGIGDLTFFSRVPHGGGAATGVAAPGGDGGRDRHRRGRRLLPRAQRPLRPTLQRRRRRHRHDVRPDPLGLVHAVRSADAGELGGDVHAALHARVRRHQRGSGAGRGVDAQARGQQSQRVLLRQAADASRSTRARAGSSSRCTSSTAARRPTAAAPSWSPRPSARATSSSRRRSSAASRRPPAPTRK